MDTPQGREIQMPDMGRSSSLPISEAYIITTSGKLFDVRACRSVSTLARMEFRERQQFYRDVLGLKVLENHLPAVGFEFGSNQLWIDRVTGLSQAELWLEIVTDDVHFSAFQGRGCRALRRDRTAAARVRWLLDLESGLDHSYRFKAWPLLFPAPNARPGVASSAHLHRRWTL